MTIHEGPDPAPAAASAGLARPEGRLLVEAEEKLGDALDASEHAPDCPAPSVGLRGCGCWRTLVFQALDRLRAVTLKTAARQPAEWEQDYVCSSCCAPESFGHDKCLGTPENPCDCITCLRAASAGEGALRLLERVMGLPPGACEECGCESGFNVECALCNWVAAAAETNAILVEARAALAPAQRETEKEQK